MALVFEAGRFTPAVTNEVSLHGRSSNIGNHEARIDLLSEPGLVRQNVLTEKGVSETWINHARLCRSNGQESGPSDPKAGRADPVASTQPGVVEVGGWQASLAPYWQAFTLAREMDVT